MRILFSLLLLSGLSIATFAQPQSKGVKIAGGSAPLGTERRVAIILANQDYADNRLDLKKAYNDADDIKQILELLGFEVIVFEKDLSRVKLDRLLIGLETKVRGFNVAFFFYSGHGSEHEGNNYLLPTDMPELEYRSDIATYGIPLSRVYSALKHGGIKTSFVMIDACRSLPMGRSFGLATGMVMPTSNPTGTYTMFATRSGNVAQENAKGRNGYFTQELCKNLRVPNLNINKIFYETRRGVKAATKEQQEPSSLDELDDEFVFVETKLKPNKASDPTSQILEAKQAFEDKEYPRAFRLLKANTQRLDAEAQFFLGEIYFKEQTGVESNKNADEGIAWYIKAAEQGYLAAQIYLGYIYEKGLGGKYANMRDALVWYRKAADNDHSYSQYQVGLMHELGNGGLATNEVEALKWYQKASIEGKEVDHSFYWLNGNGCGQYRLGLMYELGKGGLTVNEEEALKWYQKVAAQDTLRRVPETLYRIGFMYEMGKGGLPVDLKQAVEWYKKAAKEKNVDALYQLGLIEETGKAGYVYGRGALNWYNEAADQNHIESLYRMGIIYQNGTGGIRKDKEAAETHYRKAARMGHELAQKALKKMGKSWQ